MKDDRIIRQISDYSEIFHLIWEELGIRAGQKALDIGVGNKALSAKSMLEQKLEVVGIDIDPSCQIIAEKLGFPIYICDTCSLPLKDSSFDFSIAFFSMHEIDPKKHVNVLSEIKRVSKNAIIIEPLPHSDEIGKTYDRIWQEAMNSIGKFEIYQPIVYWVNLISRLKPKKTSQFQFKMTKRIDNTNANDFCQQSIEHFKIIGVDSNYINEIRGLIEKIKTYGMEHSDVIIIVVSFNKK